MDVFQLDQALIDDYQRFARSFTEIRSADIRKQVTEEYANRRYWPEPLVSLNPHFEPGDPVDGLAASGTLHPNTAAVFHADGAPVTLHRHQAQATAKAVAKQSFIVTTGTGSGKSLCFFAPIVDAAARARAAGEVRRAVLWAELDGWHARAYTLSRDQLRYVLDSADTHGGGYPYESFHLLRENEQRRHGEYRTCRLVLDAWSWLTDRTLAE